MFVVPSSMFTFPTDSFPRLAKRCKLRMARDRIAAYEAKSGRRILLEIDGGVKVDNIAAIARAGADTFVAGSAIFGTKDYVATVAKMRAELAKAG